MNLRGCVLIGSVAVNGLRLSRESRAVAGLLVLCLLLALGTARSDLFPGAAANPLPPMEREALPLALLAVGAGVLAVVRGARWPRGAGLGTLVAISLGMFLVPAVLVDLGRDSISAYTRVVAFSLTPVFAVVMEQHVGDSPIMQSRGALVAALAVVAGELCLFPVDRPGSIEAVGAFAAVIAAVGCLAYSNCQAVRVASSLPSGEMLPAVTIASAAAAVSLAAASTLLHGVFLRQVAVVPELAWAVAIALPGLLLLFWLMRRMTAAGMTTRFVLAPWMLVVAGMVLERPAVTARMALGLALMAVGAGWLLVGPRDESDETRLELS